MKRDVSQDRTYLHMPRGLLDCVATVEDNTEKDERFGPWGKQKCKDTGALTVERMETVDSEFTDHMFGFMRETVEQKKPFFAWYAPSRMHIYTHLKKESRYLVQPYSSSDDIYGSGLMELDGNVGQILAEIDRLGVSRNTIVLFTSDNGAMAAWWPDAGTTPFRSEKATTWEGGVRVPMLVRWPDRIKPGSVSNGIQTHMDLFTTLAAAAGVDDVAGKLRQSHKVLIEGVNNLATWRDGAPSKRNYVLMYNETQLTAVRFGPWKTHFKERNGFFDYFRESALMFNLRMDPLEHRDGHYSVLLTMKKAFLRGVIRDLLDAHFASFKEFPPRQAGRTLKPTPTTIQ